MTAMDGQLYLLAVTILLLFALAITLPVIRDIVREGLDRHHERKTDSLEAEPTGPDGSGDELDADRRRCPHCGTVNDSEYSFCQGCSERL